MPNPLTHLLWGYMVSRRLEADPKLVAFGLAMSVLPDIDSIPFLGMYHHGFTHTPFFVLFVCAIVYGSTRSRSLLLLALCNLGAHVALDAVATGTPLIWLYPHTDAAIALGIGWNLPSSLVIKVFLFAFPLLYILQRYREHGEDPLEVLKLLEGALGRPTAASMAAMAAVCVLYFDLSFYLVGIS